MYLMSLFKLNDLQSYIQNHRMKIPGSYSFHILVAVASKEVFFNPLEQKCIK